MLGKKMLRDLKENKGANIACTVVIIIGLMVFSAFSMVLENLKLSQQNFYQNQHFADGFARVVALPPAEISRLEGIAGIAAVQGRIVKDVRVLFPGRNENIYLRLVSVDPDNDNPINGMLRTQGVPFTNREAQVWIDTKFFAANQLSLFDEIEIIAGGRKRKLQVIDVGQSPEFIYALRTVADIYPSPETFGIAFIPLEIMNSLFPQEQSFNDLVFTLQPGVDFDEVKNILEPQLQPYGLISLISRAEQTSHFLLSQELQGLESAAKGVPVIFLSIAAMILYIMLKRLIEQQRGQVGILMALGYTRQEIIVHYLSYALTIGLFGGLVGGLAGIALSYPFTSFYQLFFNMPDLVGKFSPWYLIFSISLALAFSLIAGYQGSKKVLTLEPAEAMRPPAPVAGGKTWLEMIPFFWNMLTVQGMMAVRNLSRNKGRSTFIFLGVMFCFAISAFTLSMNDLVQKMLFDQFEKAEVYDVKITLAGPLDQDQAVQELQGFPGVKNVEAMAEIPATLKQKWHKKDVALLGIPANSNLYKILDKNYNQINPPQNGLLLSERLAMLLEAEIGTKVGVENLLVTDSGQDEELIVVGIIPQYVGINAYMELHALQDFLKQEGLVTSLMLSMDEESIPLLQEKYLQSEAIAGIDEKGQRLAKLEEMMASYGSMIYIYALFGIIIGFTIIYSSSIITVSERSRELASMMVLGMTPAEVLSVVTFEQWFIGGLAMAAGIPMAKLMLTGISQTMSSDVFTMPTDMTSTSFLLAFLVTGASIWVAQQVAARKIKSMSLVEVLKATE